MDKTHLLHVLFYACFLWYNVYKCYCI